MKKVWGVIGIVIIIAGITAGRLYIKNKKAQQRQEQQISQEDARQLIENQRQEKIEKELAEQRRVRDSAAAAEQALRQSQINEMKALQEQLQKEIDAQQ